MEKIKTNGQINIDYSVTCPHCNTLLDDYYDKKWFEDTMGEDFPVDDGYRQSFEATCPDCKEEFIIDGFRY